MSANYVVDGSAGLVNRETGQWVWWPNAGSAAVDPYTRYYFLTQKRLPISKFETVEVETKRDESGRPLSADCVYQLAGQIPETRWWSLASYVPGETGLSKLADHALSSHDVIAEPDGTVVINISQDISAGNWLKPEGDDEFTLLLRLYNPVNKLGSGAVLSNAMPRVTRQVCQ